MGSVCHDFAPVVVLLVLQVVQQLVVAVVVGVHEALAGQAPSQSRRRAKSFTETSNIENETETSKATKQTKPNSKCNQQIKGHGA